MAYRILITGTRTGWYETALRGALNEAFKRANADGSGIVFVHGGAEGVDEQADLIVRAAGFQTEVHPASEHESPKHRNDYMVRLGASQCLAFAETWASGTGHCARAARAAGIPTFDYGVPTAREDRPR